MKPESSSDEEYHSFEKESKRKKTKDQKHKKEKKSKKDKKKKAFMKNDKDYENKMKIETNKSKEQYEEDIRKTSNKKKKIEKNFIASDNSYKTTDSEKPIEEDYENDPDKKIEYFEQTKANYQEDLDTSDQKKIIREIKVLKPIETILKYFGPEKQENAKKFIKEKTIGYELEGAQKLHKKIKKCPEFFLDWINENKPGEEENSSDSSDSDEEGKKEKNVKKTLKPHKQLANDFKMCLLIKYSVLKKLKLDQVLFKNQNKYLLRLRDNLNDIFKNRPKYQKLLYSSLEFELIKFPTIKKDKEKRKKSKEIINKEIQEFSKKNLRDSLYICKTYNLSSIKKIKIPKNIEKIIKYPEELWGKLINPVIANFEEKLEKKCEDSEFSPHPKLLFEKCLEMPNFTVEFLTFFKTEYEKFDDQEFYLFLLNFNNEEKLNLITQISEIFFFEELIDLEYYNKVNISQSLEAGRKIYEKLEEPPKPSFESLENRDPNLPKKNKRQNKFIENVLDQLIGNIKRGEPFQNLFLFFEKIKWLKKLKSFLNFRFMITLFLSLSDSPVCLRIQKNISKIMAIPLTFYDPKFFLKKNKKLLLTNYHLSFAIINSHLILNLNIGLMSDKNINYERLLNRLFYTKFENSNSKLFRQGCIDANFDGNLDSPRSLSFLTVYGMTKDTFLLEKLEPLVNMIILQISIFDLTKNENKNETNLIEKIFKFCISHKIPIFLIVRDYKKKLRKTDKYEITIRNILKIKDENFKILFMNEKYLLDDKEQTYSDFEIKINKTINDKIQEIQNEEKKMTKDRFLKTIVGRENYFRNKENTDIEKLDENLEQDKQLIERLENIQKDQKNYYKTIETVNEFIEKIDLCILNDKFTEKFFFNKLFLTKRQIITEIRQKQHKKKEKKNVIKLEKELDDIKNQIRNNNPSDLIKDFYFLIMSKEYAIILILLVSKLGQINKKVQEPMNQKMDELKKREAGILTKDEKIEVKKEIQKLYIQSLGSAVSVEVLFRNIFPFLKENSTWLRDGQRDKLKNRLIDLLLNGFALELVDGENLEFKPDFFIDLQSRIGPSKVCTVGCMGPQSSGKSTLLNYMFGTLFHTSQGRCTSGLYLSIQRVRDPRSSIKYLVIIDSEGLHSSERNDPEYDRKICSFLMNNIDLLMVNVKGEMKVEMTKDLEITLFTANKLKSFKQMPEIYFVFNQSNVNNEETLKTLHKQIKGMNSKIINGMKKSGVNIKPEDVKEFNLDLKYLNVLGNAFVPLLKEADMYRGQSKNYNFKFSSKLFGQETSILSEKVLNYVLSIPVDSKMKNFGRYFKKSHQGWKMIEKYTDLTKIADIETLNKKFEINEAAKKLFENFKPYYKNLIDEKLEKLDEFIINTEDSHELDKGVKNIVEKDDDELKKSLEHWRQNSNIELEKSKYPSDMRDEFLGKYYKELEIQFIGYKLNVKSKTKIQKINFYSKTGPEMIILEAEKFRSRHTFKNLEYEEKVKKTDEKFEEVYKNFLKNFTDDSEIAKLEEYQYEMIYSMSRNLNSLMPVRRLAYIVNEVSIKNLNSKLQNELIEDNMILISEDKIRNMETDFSIRLSNASKKYFNIQGAIQKSVRVEYLENLKDDFILEEYEKDLFEKLFGVDVRNEYDIKTVYDFKDHLTNFGIIFDFPSFGEFKKKLKDKRNIHSFSKNLVRNKRFRTTYINLIEPNKRKYFKIKKISLKPNEIPKYKNKVYFKELYNDAIPNQTISDVNTREKISIFINPLDCENQSRVMRAMTFVLLKYFNFNLVLEEIKQMCYRVIYNLKSHQSIDTEVDLNNVSEVTSDLLIRVISQELERIFYKINQDFEICCAEMSDPLMGFFVYITILFLWKFTVEAMKQKHSQKFVMLEDKREEYYNYFKNTALDNKEQQPIDIMSTEIHNLIHNKFSIEVNKIKSKAKTDVMQESVGKEFNCLNLNKKLIKQFFIDTNPELFEDTYEYMQDPVLKLKNHLDKVLIPKYFEEPIKKLENKRNTSIYKSFERITITLELLEKHFLKYISGDNYSCHSYFTVFTDSTDSEEMTKFKHIKEHMDCLAEFGFRFVAGVIKNEQMEQDNIIEGKDILTRFIISKEELNDLNYDIRHESKFQEFRDSESGEVLCPILNQIIDTAISKKQDRIYNFKTFFKSLQDKIKKEIENCIKLNPVDRGSLNIEEDYQRLQIEAIGCTAVCKFCKKKCEHPYPYDKDPHKHYATSTGHQPRIFAHGYVMKKDKKLASKICCDLVEKDRIIKLNGVDQTWEQSLNAPGMEDWDIEAGKSIHQFETELNAYEKMWKIHGKRICERIGKGIEDDGKTIREFIKEYNENKKDVISHYIIAVDESGSMSSNNNFGKAMNGVKTFVEYLRNSTVDTKCYITLILFNYNARIIYSGVILRDFPQINVRMKGGGTNFSPALKKCIQSVNSLKQTVEISRILFYTDGMAGYPAKRIDEIKEMINNQGVNLKLHFFTLDHYKKDDPNNVFNLAKKRLGDKSTIDSDVKSEQLGGKFIEIFEMD